MRVLLTGGTGVIGKGTIPALVSAGHEVRLLTRGAEQDAREWPEGVEAWPADITDPDSMRGAADGCDAVVHVVGIVKESPPEVTFQSINVDGTRNVVREAKRAGVSRFVYLSSLGAETGESDYHRSKLAAESVVAREFPGSWTVLRPGAVYGPGDEVISALLVLVRSLPAVPVLGDGDQRFQPIWYEDLGAAILRTLERDDLAGRTLELAGAEVTTTHELLDRFAQVEDRDPPRVPIPGGLASLGSRMAEHMPLTDLLERATGLEIPLDRAKLQMLAEENVVRSPEGNGLIDVLGITPTPLEEGVRRLAEELPERLPDEGMGPLERKRFWADIRGASMDADALMTRFRENLADMLPVEVIEGPEGRAVEAGDTIELSLFGRGNVAVRVEEAEARHLTLGTIEGHPLAGIVRFLARGGPDDLRFMVEIHTRAAGAYDLFLMRTAGETMQKSTWKETVRRAIEASGGEAPEGVQHEKTKLEDEEARAAEQWIEGMVQARRAAENARKT